jgi:hypothetical protein
LTAEDWLRLDQDVQDAVKEHFHGLTSVAEALGGGSGLKPLRAAIVQGAGTFLSQRLPLKEDMAELFLAQQPDEQALTGALRQAFAAAAPVTGKVPLPHERETALLLAPASEAGERFLDAARHALPDIKGVTTANWEEIVFYRECVGLAFEDLEPLGLVCPAAYVEAFSAGQFTPHARVDVFWNAPVRR